MNTTDNMNEKEIKLKKKKKGIHRAMKYFSQFPNCAR